MARYWHFCKSGRENTGYYKTFHKRAIDSLWDAPGGHAVLIDIDCDQDVITTDDYQLVAHGDCTRLIHECAIWMALEAIRLFESPPKYTVQLLELKSLWLDDPSDAVVADIDEVKKRLYQGGYFWVDGKPWTPQKHAAHAANDAVNFDLREAIVGAYRETARAMTSEVMRNNTDSVTQKDVFSKAKHDLNAELERRLLAALGVSD